MRGVLGEHALARVVEDDAGAARSARHPGRPTRRGRCDAPLPTAASALRAFGVRTERSAWGSA
eukprot:CAMPEP_0175308208 /NCGR_PEP_ID=MMETSP0093-20121207/65173_1 /TAXON_ID=311494 /ORGANISM="Alexandrium monilatum, Strain CCMP3105" /LENGTH=62 /DNA_ID=CAMNT_0016604723 /DNA_START=29 /DNA_END=213 /DNA_ORIENTATION=-